MRKEMKTRASHICREIYIYVLYTPNLGLRIAVFDQEREQRGSIKGV